MPPWRPPRRRCAPLDAPDDISEHASPSVRLWTRGEGEAEGFALPRSARRQPGGGRFALDPELFPGVVGPRTGLRQMWRWQRNVERTVRPPESELEARLPVRPVRPTSSAGAPAAEATPPDACCVRWLGHAAALVHMHGWAVLTDPALSERCAPVQRFGPSVTRRLRPAPATVDDLPHVDVVVVSHNHYDHLDRGTVRALARRERPPLFVVPLGLRAWLQAQGVGYAVELDWGETAELPGDAAAGRPMSLRCLCVPCQHWCARGAFDRNRCLWSSWLLSTSQAALTADAARGALTVGEGARAFFGGDTGYCGNIWRRLGALCAPTGGIDVAIMPIGAYGSPGERWFHADNHMSAPEAVQTMLDIGAAALVPVHWGTWQLTAEPLFEPPQLLEEAAEAAGVAGAMHVLDMGEMRALPTRKRQIEPARCAGAIASPAPVAVAVAHSYALYRAIIPSQLRPSVGRPSVVLPIATRAGATCATPPHVTCWLACDAEHFRAEFNICGEVAPRAQVHANNGEVWTDSCVEVFLAAPCGEGRDTGYLNFELSCTGALLAGHVVGGMARLDGGASPPTLLLPEEMAPIRVRTEGAGNAEWRAEIDVPWALIEARLGCARPGRSGAPASAKLASKRRCWRVNAYCIKDGGDESLRHYLSAFAVDEPHVGPFFHQPACFAPLAFLP